MASGTCVSLDVPFRNVCVCVIVWGLCTYDILLLLLLLLLLPLRLLLLLPLLLLLLPLLLVLLLVLVLVLALALLLLLLLTTTPAHDSSACRAPGSRDMDDKNDQ